MTTAERGLRPIHAPERRGGINKKLAALALTGVVAAGGIGIWATNQGQETDSAEPTTPIGGAIGLPIENTPRPLQTEVIVNTPKPTEVVKETPKPIETPALSMEQMASNFAFDYWYSLLSKPQEKDNGSSYFYFTPTRQNTGEWEHNIDIIKSGGLPDLPLVVNWTGGEIYYPTENTEKGLAIKTQGTIIFTNIKFETVSIGLSGEDKKEGITWKGNVFLNYDLSYAENQYWPSSNDIPLVNTESLKTWLNKKESEPLLPMSDTLNTSYDAELVVLKNGKWEYVNKDVYSNLDIPLAQIKKPSGIISDLQLCQSPTSFSACQIIYKDSPYN